jgi:hypothetical protein
MNDAVTPTGPDYSGRSLPNLVAELERRLTGSSVLPGLTADLSNEIGDAQTYVLVLFDGLGSHQLSHPAAAPLSGVACGEIDAPFPTTTTVSLSAISTGLAPAGHGLLGHLIWLPEQHTIANALKWIAPGGDPVEIDTAGFLPTPNTWERLRGAGIEPITVQPGNFADTPLSRALYRGCRHESIWSHDEFIDAVVDLSRQPHRLIFAYLPEVDFAAHLYGQASAEYGYAIRTVVDVWERISARLDGNAVMVGTADHGHLDYPESGKHFIARNDAPGVTLFGDTRALYARGDADAIAALGETLPATWHDLETMRPWWGPGDHPDLDGRAPSGVFLADGGRVLIPGHMDKRLIGYHGGLDPRELKIPLLVAEP